MGRDLAVSARRWQWAAIAAVLCTALLLGACGGDSDDESAATGADTGGATEAGSEEPLRLAYLSFAVANSFDAPMLAAAQTAAAGNNAELEVFDANNNADTQFQQFQDAIAAGEYDGIIVQPIFGAALVELADQAIAEGIEVGNVNTPLGPDTATTEAQVEGLSANVVDDFAAYGTKLGELTVEACQDVQATPCQVGYMYNIKASALDVQIRTSFDEAIAADTNIEVVAEGEAFFNVQGGLTATQDILQAEPDVNVLVSSDQGLTGSLQALEAAGRTGEVVLIAYGGGAVGLQNVASGAFLADIVQTPASMGRFVVEDLVTAIREGAPQPSRVPTSELPHDGIAREDNVSDFTAEWPG